MELNGKTVMTDLLEIEALEYEQDVVKYLIFAQQCTIESLEKLDLLSFSVDNFENKELVTGFLYYLVRKNTLECKNGLYCLSEKAKKEYYHYELVVRKDKETLLYQPYMDEFVAKGNREILDYLSKVKHPSGCTLTVR
jgi:hypothetical protein